MSSEKLYNAYSDYLKNKYGEKVYKLEVMETKDAAFVPNAVQDLKLMNKLFL